MAEIDTLTADPQVARTLGLDRDTRTGGRRRLALWALGLGALGAVLWLGFAPGAAERPAYVTRALEVGDLVVEIAATGTIEPTRQVDLSSELSGIVRDVAVDFNDRVRKGDRLATLDTEKLDAQARRARATLGVQRAGLVQAEATLAQADRALERTRALAGRNVSTEQALDVAIGDRDRAAAAVEVARAQVTVAQADVSAVETDLRKSVIVSPIDGVVLSRAVDPGQTVASSLQAPVIFTLAEDLASMRLEADIDEADVGRVREGQTARFTVDAFPDTRFEARVAQLRYAPETIDNVVTYTAVLSLDNAERLLRPGMTATATIEIERVAGALLAPNAALRYAPPADAAPSGGGVMSWLMPRPPRDTPRRAPAADADGQRTLYVLHAGATEPEAVTVRVGATDGERTVVSGDGVAEGDLVVVARERAR